MNILISGVTGFLGSNLAEDLLSKGYNVIGLKRITSATTRINDLLNNPNFTVYNVDPDFDLIRNYTHIDIIIHTATNYGGNNTTTQEMIDANELFSLALLDIARKNKTTFINTHTSLPLLTNEYSVSKNNFLNWGKYYSNNYKLKFINIVLEHFYGYNDGRFIDYIIKSLNNNVDKIDLTPGEQQRDFIYIKDVVSAYIFIIENLNKTTTNYTDIELGSGQTITIKELVVLLKKLTHNTATTLNFGGMSYRPNEAMESKANISYLKNLGWKPKFNLSDGLLDNLAKYI